MYTAFFPGAPAAGVPVESEAAALELLQDWASFGNGDAGQAPYPDTFGTFAEEVTAEGSWGWPGRCFGIDGQTVFYTFGDGSAPFVVVPAA